MRLLPVNRQARAQALAAPAPVLGLNERDPPDQLQPGEAFVLDNWFPDNDGVIVRPGSALHATGVGSGTVETLAEFRGTGRKLIAGGGGELWDATAQGPASALTTKSYTSNEWQTHNFGQRLVGCNGQDIPWHYDGTTVADQNWTATVPASFDQKDLINVTSHESRLYYLHTSYPGFLFGPTGAVTGGALSAFDLSQIALHGGMPVAQGSWSTIRGNELQDFLVTVMDTGEVIVYAGDDPGEATAWQLVGRYIGPRPCGRRCMVNTGGDLMIVTENGVIPVSTLVSGRAADDIILHQVYGKTVPGIRDQTRLTGNLGGWSSFYVPTGRSIYFNMPLGGDKYRQYVLNPLVGAWGRYNDLPAYQFASLGRQVYFASTGGRVLLHEGVDDYTPEGDQQIIARARTGFSYLGYRGRRKTVTMGRPIIILDGLLDGTLALDADFANTVHPANTTCFGQSGSTTPWGSAWGSPWSQPAQRGLEWKTLFATGYSFSTYLEVRVSAQTVKWQTMDYLGSIGSVR